MKGSEDKCSCIKYDENGVSEQFGDAVFISVIFSRGGISPFWSPWPFPAAGISSLGASGRFPRRGIHQGVVPRYNK